MIDREEGEPRWKLFLYGAICIVLVIVVFFIVPPDSGNGEVRKIREDGTVIEFQTMQDKLDQIANLKGKLKGHGAVRQSIMSSKIVVLQNEVQIQLLQQILLHVSRGQNDGGCFEESSIQGDSSGRRRRILQYQKGVVRGYY